MVCHVKLTDPTAWVQLKRRGTGRQGNEDVFCRQPDPCEGCGEHHWIFQGVIDGRSDLVYRAGAGFIHMIPDELEQMMESCYQGAVSDLQEKVKEFGVPDNTAPDVVPEEWQ